MRNILILFFFVTVAAAHANPIITATCDEPVGTRYDLQNSEVRSQDDGFSGVRPVFIIDDNNPETLTFVWGASNSAKTVFSVKDSVEKAKIISKTDEKITAVRTVDHGVTQMFSLYPRENFVFFTQHRHIGWPTSSTFYSNCQFKETKRRK